MTVYYAFKQSETDKKDGGMWHRPGWETMLQGLLKAGFSNYRHLANADGEEQRVRSQSAPMPSLPQSSSFVARVPMMQRITTRRGFYRNALRRELPEALQHLQKGNIAPVDLAQAAIGPGIAVFSRYGEMCLKRTGVPCAFGLPCRLSTQNLTPFSPSRREILTPTHASARRGLNRYGMKEGAFGDADVLARAKNSSVEGISESGVLRATAGKVRLLSRDEYPDEWNPTSDGRRNTWKCTQYLIRALERGGETEAGRLVNLLGGGASEDARALAYRLYAISDRKGWAQEAVPYNMLVTSWTHIQAAARSDGEERQGDLF